MSAFTPGPWEVGDAARGDDPRMVYCNDATGQRVADCSGEFLFHSRETMEANARLVATAPELLKQLKELLGFANFVINELDIDTESTEVILRANGEAVAKVPLSVVLNNSKAAIAAAEGRP